MRDDSNASNKKDQTEHFYGDNSIYDHFTTSKQLSAS